MKTFAVIGKNFGDEGKGLACALLAKKASNSLIIKHNGGGQAGHTVEDESGARFIHHQIGSGAEYGATTLLSSTFLVDLFQLEKEVSEFKEMFGFAPPIFAEKDTKITVIDDVLRNMLIESSRGSSRHGSCGMGINECVNRHENDLVITLEDVRDMSFDEILGRLREFRSKYGQKNIENIKNEYDKNSRNAKNRFEADSDVNDSTVSYYEMLKDDDVLFGFASCIKEAVNLVTLVDASKEWLSSYDQLIFETGQGLLLDNDYAPYAPFLTPSKTGLHNIAAFLDKRELELDEVIYVTRSYVTRHGNGPLPCEIDKRELPGVLDDLTNVKNEWQGNIRYAKHEDIDTFVKPISDDIKSVAALKSIRSTSKSLLITHLNETDGKVCFKDHDIPALALSCDLQESYGFSKVYTSSSPWFWT